MIATNTARAEGRRIKGGEAPFVGGQDFFEVQDQEVSGESFAAFMLLVGRGLGRSAQMVGRRSQRFRRNSPGLEGRSALLTGGGSASLAKALAHGGGPKVF